jgi:hypothetical protein
MPNIKFSYLYRDGANYKNYGSVIFANPTNIELSALESLIKSKLIFGEWFYVDEWKLPDLHFDTWDNELDHTFHEFKNVEYTDEAGGELLFIEELNSLLEKINCKY